MWTFESISDGSGGRIEISGLKGRETRVASGPDAGMPLSELIYRYESEVVGARTFSRFGTLFPLVIRQCAKRIDINFTDSEEGLETFLAGVELLSDGTFRIQDCIGIEKGDDPVILDAIPDIPVNVVKSPHFTANILAVDRELMRDYIEKDTFVVVIALEGEAWLTSRGDRRLLKAGSTALVSALSTGLIIEPVGEFTAMEAYI